MREHALQLPYRGKIPSRQWEFGGAMFVRANIRTFFLSFITLGLVMVATPVYAFEVDPNAPTSSVIPGLEGLTAYAESLPNLSAPPRRILELSRAKKKVSPNERRSGPKLPHN